MKNKYRLFISVTISLGILFFGGFQFLKSRSINKQLQFIFPVNGALFPRDFAPPTFNWSDDQVKETSWIITVNLKQKDNFFKETVHAPKWKPGIALWDSIKTVSRFKDIELIVERNRPNQSLFKEVGKLIFKISTDEVAAPILYRQIPLPFSFAEKNIELTSYSVCNVASPKPFHNVLGSFKVCGNCHSISQDGKTVALDFDAVSRDKGGYFIAKIDSVTHIDRKNYVSWSKMSGRNTFGLLSKISWNGKYIATTIKDRVVSKKIDNIDTKPYSQLFFPVNGVIAFYDIQTGELKELPGANDPEYVQSNAVWTPDDKNIIFARAKALPFPENEKKFDCFVRDDALIDQYYLQKKELKFDLYIVPFNNGKGGVAMPIKGASANGKSNYFPTVSPDGKWLVFCQAGNFMMLRPDSRLYIVPVAGGEAKMLKCNFKEMNSWHAWSPNGKWLVYVSKALDIYTDMFLTHIDEHGNASIPVLVENAKRPECAVNYPEFINADPDLKFTMDYSFINSIDIEDAIEAGKIDSAKVMLEKFINQSSLFVPTELTDVAHLYQLLGNKSEAAVYAEKAKAMDKEFSKVK